MKIYISGKMNGDPNFEEKFFSYEAKLQQQGFTTVNPARFGKAFNEAMLIKNGREATYKEHLLNDIDALSMCDAIFLLPDWDQSPGAIAEYTFAKAIQLTVIIPSAFPKVNIN